MTPLDEKGLPANLDAERFVLGALLLDGTSHAEVAAALQAEDFSIEAHRRLYERMGELASRGDQVDRVTLANELMKHDQLDSVGGLSYLVSLDDGMPSTSNLDAYVRIVKDKSTLRRAIYACHDTMQRLTMAGPEAIEQIQAAERILHDLSAEAQSAQRLKNPAEIIGACEGGYEGFMSPHKMESGVPTPWTRVNEFITGGGMRPGQLWTLAAVTSRGKTATALQIGEYAASCGKGVAVFAIEMTAEECLRRVVSSRARVDSRKWHAGFVNRGERDRLQHTVAEVNAWPLFIDDTTTASLPAIDSALRKLMAQQSIGLVIIDYLQIMRAAGKFDTRAQEVGSLARGCKLLARQYNVPVLMLSQFSRQKADSDRPPQLEDLKESSEIEQASDGIIFLHSRREDWQENADVVHVDVIFAKQRGGPTGNVTDGLYFHRPFVRLGQSMADFEVAA